MKSQYTPNYFFMNLNESGIDSQTIQNALKKAVGKFDQSSIVVDRINREDDDLNKFKTLIEESKYFPIDQLQSFSIPTIVNYLKNTNRFIQDAHLVTIQDLFHDLAIKAACIQADYEEIYNLFSNFKKMLMGQIGVSLKQLYPFSQYVDTAEHSTIDLEDFQQKVNSFCLDKFIDHHGTDAQILLARVIYLLKERNPDYRHKELYKTLIDELSLLKRVMFTIFLIEQDVLIPKLIKVKENLNIK